MKNLKLFSIFKVRIFKAVDFEEDKIGKDY